MSAGKTTTKCCINSDGSVCLENILDSFNSSLKEEHAWALCYQCAKFYSGVLSLQQRPPEVLMVTEIRHVYLRTDGNVHENTIIDKSVPRKQFTSEKDLVAGLGVVIYSALDRGNDPNEERVISEDLEELISDMIPTEMASEDGQEGSQDVTASPSSHHQHHHETDDEGIEKDSEEGDEEPCTSSTARQQQQVQEHHQSFMRLSDVIRRCDSHLGTLTKTQAEAHYKAVVRALVAEALELATFLERVAQGSISLATGASSKRHASELDQLNFSDWAKFWVQVMGELRMGVKLKKVHYHSKAPIEFELTPYEILMKDIRSCRYNLRKIMVNGNIPSRVTKDAHAIILEFIRSRPPLKKATDRKLPPQPRTTLTPREQLLNSIRKGRKLKPTPTPRSNLNMQQTTKEPRQSTLSSAATTKEEPTSSTANATKRRLIKVDFSQFEDDDDDDEEEEDTTFDSPDSTTIEPGLWSTADYLTATASICPNDHHRPRDTTLDAYDLATQDLLSLRANARRHSTLEVCDPPALGGCYSVPQSRPCSRQSCNSSEAESVQLEPEVAKAIQEELTNAKTWQDTISLDDRLSLTLSEIVHIRAVLTKAELEALPVEGRVRHDVETRKVCFLCLKTRFGIFGPWGQRCTLCKRTVCSRCYSKMNIPMEHFSSVPVVLLSPSIMCTPEDEHKDSSSFTKNLVNKIMDPGTPGTPDRSPDPSRPGSSMESSIISDPGGVCSSSSSMGMVGGRFRTKGQTVGRAARVVDRLNNRGGNQQQMVVCHDCKMMVLQIIKSARANRSAIRNKTLQSLTLNLSPVF